MEFIDIPAEQTTAITDAVLVIIALTVCIALISLNSKQSLRLKLWIVTFADLGIASFLGALSHGFKWSEIPYNALWNLIYLALGLLVAFFVIAVMFDLWGETYVRRYAPIILLIGLFFWLIALIWPDSFIVFILYEMVAMIFALGGYAFLSYKKALPGALWMTMGIFITIIAAVIQATALMSFTLIWEFDHNGVYHLVQMVAIGILMKGLRQSEMSD